MTAPSFIVLRNDSDGHTYLGKILYKLKGMTFGRILSVRQVIRIDLDWDRALAECFPPHSEGILERGDPAEVPAENTGRLVKGILDSNPDLTPGYFTIDAPRGEPVIEIVPQIVDSFSVAFRLFGLDPRDVPPLTEEQVMDFEIDTMFGPKVGRTPDGKHFFDLDGKVLYVHKVHNTSIERCLGVDLIYNFVEQRRILFIQYKCLSKGDRKFYKSGDPHLRTEMARMKAIPGVDRCHNFGEVDREALRICRCPVYVKLCSRRPQSMRAAPSGFYYPLCIWEHLYRSTDSYLTLKDGPRLSNDQFADLVGAGLLGSTPAQASDIEAHLIDGSGDERLKLIFEERTT